MVRGETDFFHLLNLLVCFSSKGEFARKIAGCVLISSYICALSDNNEENKA